MMSTKTLFPDTPTTPAPAGPAAAGANATSAGEAGATSPFQHLLTAQPVAPIPAILDALAQQAGEAMTARPVQPVKLPEVKMTPLPTSGSAMLQILTDSASLLPGASEASQNGLVDLTADPGSAEQLVIDEKSDDEILAEWLDASLPMYMLGAPVTTDGVNGGESGGAGESSGDAETAAERAAALLTRSVTTAERDAELQATAALAASVATNPGTNPGAHAASQIKLIETQSAAVAAAAFGAEPKDRADASDRGDDAWLSALGDLGAKRGAEAAAAVPTRNLSTPVHDARWADALAHRLVMMARDGESVASLKLVPLELGPLDIQINVRDSQATVHFGAAQAETRAALEASLPRLRELLSSQGLELANASVSQQAPREQRSERSATPGGVSPVGEDAEVTTKRVVSNSLLDIYA
jgi:flagellar hook-length control protein FliK